MKIGPASLTTNVGMIEDLVQDLARISSGLRVEIPVFVILVKEPENLKGVEDSGRQ